jgi:DeoR/GlpR family transcriptional regulator of sugar metabolism
VQASNSHLLDFDWQSARMGDEKRRIAKAAAQLIEDGQTVILDGGSTVAAVARELVHRSLQVVTNSLPIAEILLDAPAVDVTLTGGYLHPRIRVMLGPFCEHMLSTVRADVVIMGIGSITAEGLSNNNTLVVGSEKRMIEVANRVIVVADRSKFGKGAMFPLAPLDVVDVMVTEDRLAPEHLTLLEAHGVKVLLA